MTTAPIPDESGEEDEDGGTEETRRVPVAVRVWKRTRDMLDAIAAEDYPHKRADRRRSLTARDLWHMGMAARAAGYRPGDVIPPKRTTVPKRVRR
jgi:hypothetical protein